MNCFMVALLALGTASGSADGSTEPAKAAAEARPATVHLMSEKSEARLRKMLPRVADADLQKIFDDPRLILYTDREMPRAYQIWSGDLQGVHSPYYNISANGSEPYGNGNREFPWGSPAGTHRTKDVETFRFLWLPRDENDKPLPVVWYRKRLRGDQNKGYAWTFPVGTIVGEVLAMTGPDGYAYGFELRTRTREYGYWDVDVLRPYPTSADLARRIKELRPDWEDQPNLVREIEHLEGPIALKAKTLADKQPARHPFVQTMGVDTLPAIDDNKLVGELLAGATFRSMTGEVWRESTAGVKTYAPTTTAGFNIVPANYDAGFVQIDRTSCMRCHDSVARPVADFNPGRDWYGHVRGSDGIFSFHPFAPESISDNGIGRTVKMRPEFERAGVIAKYDPDKHPEKVYHTLEK